ncbi:hypothetical protein M0D21_21935 [Aquimarina sp. D1M17]|uniref:hypothetical protein n=1 Tax=Aquimarina acroporae TaxID=2937283 RepID=UPI0020BE0AB2|nr:hypothetical protein [Aquimarina acroporae]MCK8524255.1 hypothetical protein [Aquimarina acroporae]
MKNYNSQKLKNELSNKLEMDFIFDEINEPELQDVITDVISYSQDHEFFIDEDEVGDWF